MLICDKCEEGCSWQGELRQRDEHNQECGYVVEACSNDCGEMIMRKDMDYHKQNECSHGQICMSTQGSSQDFGRRMVQ